MAGTSPAMTKEEPLRVLPLLQLVFSSVCRRMRNPPLPWEWDWSRHGSRCRYAPPVSDIFLFGRRIAKDGRSHREWHSRSAGALAKGAPAKGAFTKGALAKSACETRSPSRLSAFEFLLLVGHLGVRVFLRASDLFQWPHCE